MEYLPRQVETGLAAPAFAGPAIRVYGQDRRGAPALGLEGEEPVPGADVKHRLARQVFGELHEAQLPGRVCRVLARRDNAVTQVDVVKPGYGLHRGAKLPGAQFGLGIHGALTPPW